MLSLVTLCSNSAARLGAAARALAPLARRAASGGCAFAAAGRTLAGAVQRFSAGAGTMARGGEASQPAPLRQLGAGAAAGASAFERTVCAAAAEAPRELSPPYCALRLRKFAAQIKEKRERLKRKQDWATSRLHESAGVVRKREDEVTMYDLLRQRCQLAGDAAGVASYEAKMNQAAKDLHAEQNHREYMRVHIWQPDVDKYAAELADLERSYNMLRAYAAERYGADWERPYAKLCDDVLRQQAREWRSAEAPPSK